MYVISNLQFYSEVKAAAIPVLGKLVTDCETKEVKEKARAALESIVRDPQGVPTVLLVPLVLALAAAAPYCPQNYLEDGKCFSFIKLVLYYLKTESKCFWK